jgi:heme A synthase
LFHPLRYGSSPAHPFQRQTQGHFFKRVNFQFTHPIYLLALVPALAWVLWLFWKTDVQIGAVRRWIALVLRVVIVVALVLALGGCNGKSRLKASM